MRQTPLPCPALLLAATLAAGALVVPGDASAAVALSKTRARAAAVRVTRETCALTTWCRGYVVEPARACARRSSRRVDCDIRFRDADGRESTGLVIVTRSRGRLEVGAAIPNQPGNGE